MAGPVAIAPIILRILPRLVGRAAATATASAASFPAGAVAGGLAGLPGAAAAAGGGGGNPEVQRILRKAAVIAQSLILQRAFPSQGVGKDIHGAAFKPLSEAYGFYKSGTRPYVSDETRAKATKRRNASGKPGGGPLVDVLGVKTRLGVRPNASNQRLSDVTAKSFGIVREAPGEVTLGFRDPRSQRIAGHLHERNEFMGLTDAEQRAVIRAIEKDAAKLLLDSIVVKGGRFKIRI